MAGVPEAPAKKAAALPAATGVYLMKDGDGNVIYVGKAKNLRSRVRSYFGDSDDRAVIPFLRARIADFDYVLTATEKEALILENALIKKHRPRYNVMLRDDKNYFTIRLDRGTDFPRFELVRRMKKDGARYFGPYASSTAVKETLRLLNRFFPLRTCRDRDFASRRRPCVEYQIGRCSAPCVGYIDREEYAELLREAVLFIEGRQKRLETLIRRKMEEAADALDFEEAARMRDLLGAMEQTFEKQSIVSASFRDQDVFGLFREGDHLSVYMINVRHGTVADQRPLRLPAGRPVPEEPGEIFAALLKQYYDDTPFLPREVIISARPDDGGVIEEWLSDNRGAGVRLVVPRRGHRLDLLRMAEQNAEAALRAERERTEDREAVLSELAVKLGLRAVPRRIECFDISNIGGKFAVGSRVVFTDGVPDRKNYRRYNIRTVEGADDYAMMYEVLKRRFSGDGASSDLPDLVVVDGGRGQLGVAKSVLDELGLRSIDLLGLAKEARRGKPSIPGSVRDDEDRVYLPGRKNPLYLSRSPELRRLLQAVRDEAHRFAVTYHRKLKQKEDLASELDSIPGIGPAKKRALLARFKTVSAIRRAAPDEIAAVPGIGAALARLIKQGEKT